MTDYTKPTGSSATMLIRDTGTTVEFWINANNSTTWSDHLPWGWNINGSSGTSTNNYQPNSQWRKLGSWNVTVSQTVTFSLGATGTSGFGGPTTFNQIIDRGTVPLAPYNLAFSNITSTSVDITYMDGYNGAVAIDSREVGYSGTVGSDSTNVPAHIVSSDGSDTITGLTPGATYYFWARTHNAKGYSPWSARSTVTLLRIPDAPSTPVLSDIASTSLTATWTPNADGGAVVTAFQIGYGLTPSTQDTIISAASPMNVTGLAPGTKYYFWVRAQNAIGWSPWSAASTAMTIAGARVKVGAVWKLAIPYVKDGGVWKLARPWARNAGVWKETI